MKRSPHRDKHLKKKAIKKASHELEVHGGSEIPEQKWPYHVDHESPAKEKKPKKQSNDAHTNEVHDRSDLVCREIQNKNEQNRAQNQRLNRKIAHQKKRR